MSEPATTHNPRAVLSAWANDQDEWTRYVVRQVLTIGAALGSDELLYAYELFRQEKGLDPRVHPAEKSLETVDTIQEANEPLRITKISDVTGVNAIARGSVIEPHDGLTILFGENGTGKTGYARVLKALAGSRTAVEILGDIASAEEVPQSAEIDYTLGSVEASLVWDGTHAKAPFTRVSVFDSPAVNFHVDDDLEYVYVPAALALFNHLNSSIAGIQRLSDDACGILTAPRSAVLSRFKRESSIYPHIETLGAATDLASLKAMADVAPDGDDRVSQQQRAVSALESDTARAHLTVQLHLQKVLQRTAQLVGTVNAVDVAAMAALHDQVGSLQADYDAFRSQLFEAANLPAVPDATWESFVASGQAYREHLSALGVHDESSCLYCRQPLDAVARALINKYADYLEDKIAGELAVVRAALAKIKADVAAHSTGELATYLDEQAGVEEPSVQLALLRSVGRTVAEYQRAVAANDAIDEGLVRQAALDRPLVDAELQAVSTALPLLHEQVDNRVEALRLERATLVELRDAVELGKIWSQVEAHVVDAKEATKLTTLTKKFAGLKASVTEMSKVSSDQMVNQSFDALFSEECEALRAPLLKVQYVGRQGKSQRRKIMAGRFRPSKVLSEGQQKVLAIADFLAEARLSGISATVVFDDPVSSLDHRRVDEVAVRIAQLAESTQVIVFTHDILFATKLLSLFETTKRCTYYQVTDDDAVGQVVRASGPRWDTVKYLTGRINVSIQDAKAATGETREALVRTGYSWIRSWCEVFVESEVLNEVTMRYQPNVKMGAVEKLKFAQLPETTKTVVEVFNRACRYIDGHSQPLPSLNVTPSVKTLDDDWKILTDCRAAFLKA